MGIEENLKKGIVKKKDKIVSMLSDSMLIKHKKTKIEYTISKIAFKDGEPIIFAYRYYSRPGKGKQKRVYIKIEMKEFKEYEAV